MINEVEFWRFMERNGPNKERSKNNYISWLRFVSDNFQEINELLDQETIDDIYLQIIETQNQRSIYTKDKDAKNIKSALNKYLRFLKNSSAYVELSDSLIAIVGQTISQTTKTEIETRLGQGKYRKKLINMWGECSLTKYSKINFLIASHIKPWKDSNNEEKVDVYNGLLLKPNIDKLFDNGYISFDDDGRIKISKLLDENDQKNMGISIDMKIIKLCSEHKPYLSFHRHNVFLGD